MKKYSIYLLSGIFSVLLLVAVFNWMINPYDIFTSPEFTGLNAYKSEVERHTRLSKVYQLEREKPDALLLASSRGLVIPTSYFSGNDMNAYNLSLTSASTYELMRMLQHAQSVNPIKRVVLALDEGFTGDKQANFIENRLAVNADGTKNMSRWKQVLQDYFSSLLSIDALLSSVRTIRKQEVAPASSGAEDHDRHRVFVAGGHHQMFRTMEASIFSQYSGRVKSCDTADVERVDSPRAVDIFAAIVDFSYRNDIELFVYISPSHARLYEALCMVGKWADIENMKRAVVRIVAFMADKYGKAPYPVWDFSGYNRITTETVPDEGDRDSRMRWYWEGSHYTVEVAELIFDTIFGVSEAYGEFGKPIDLDNIDKHLQGIRNERKIYYESHSTDIEELKTLMKVNTAP